MNDCERLDASWLTSWFTSSDRAACASRLDSKASVMLSPTSLDVVSIIRPLRSLVVQCGMANDTIVGMRKASDKCKKGICLCFSPGHANAICDLSSGQSRR